MAQKKVYIGSVGPHIWDDTDLINDSDGDFAGRTYGALVTDGDILLPGGSIFASIIGLYDADISNELSISWDENDTADRALDLRVNGGDRLLSLGGDLVVEANSNINQDVTTDGAPEFSEVKLTPKVSSSGPEGTIFYCSDDNSVYVGTE